VTTGALITSLTVRTVADAAGTVRA
jgi:hypothetical protein